MPQQPRAGEDGLDGVVSKIDSRKPEKVKRRNNFRMIVLVEKLLAGDHDQLWNGFTEIEFKKRS